MRAFAILLVAAALLLQYRIWLAEDGVREVARLKQAVSVRRDANGELAQRNRQLAAEVADLKKGMTALEERARSELGMVGRSESFFQVVPRALPIAADAPTRTAQR